MTPSRLRELSRAASPAPWSILGGPEDYAVYIDGAKNIGYDGELIRPDAALIVALRNDAEKYADLREAAEAVVRAWDLCQPTQFVVDALRAALDALGGGE